MEKKAVENHICGANECNKPANRKLFFPLGFSANFCTQCANALVEQKIGNLLDGGLESQRSSELCLTGRVD